MMANSNLLMQKYIRVIEQFSLLSGLSAREAMGFFYESETFAEMEQGISDMHCRSDGYLAEEIFEEWKAARA
jgi:hypothetical protein